MAAGETLDFRIPSDVQFIEAVVDQVVRRCEARAFSRRHLSLNVPVALTEALSNAILRGNGDGSARAVVVRVEINDTRLVAEVHDEGEGFDMLACTEDATLPENRVREDGRGLFLMHKLMDRVERFTVTPGGGNVVRMVLIRA